MSVTLTWKVDKLVPTECPDFVPDPYTGEFPSTHCAVAHFREVTYEATKTFPDEVAAEMFRKNAPPSCYGWKSANNTPLIEK